LLIFYFSVELAKKAEEAELKAAEKAVKKRRKEENDAAEQVARSQRIAAIAGYVGRLQINSLPIPTEIIEGKRFPQKKEMKALCVADLYLASAFKATLGVDAIWLELKERIASLTT
jgi:hypothetical protein